jgi:hypothetical protein
MMKSLSKGKGQSMQSVIDPAIEDLRRRRLLEATSLASSALKTHKTTWAEESDEK